MDKLPPGFTDICFVLIVFMWVRRLKAAICHTMYTAITRGQLYALPAAIMRIGLWSTGAMETSTAHDWIWTKLSL